MLDNENIHRRHSLWRLTTDFPAEPDRAGTYCEASWKFLVKLVVSYPASS